jgi:RNA polymerase sigma-32 factor
MDARLNVSDADISDFQEIPDDKYTDPAKLIEYQDKHQDKEKLLHALSLLDDRSKEILYSRFLSEKKMTLTELSKKYNVSFQRICQIEKSAMEKLKVALISS